MLFGRTKEEEGRLSLILDIESGSLGAALVRRNAGNTMTIVEELRSHLPVRPGRSAGAMVQNLGELAHRLLPQFAEAGLMGGGVSDISIFMSPPWGRPNLETGRPDFVSHMQDAMRQELSPYFNHAPKFYTGAGAAAGAMRAISPFEDKYLLCIVTHEVTELLLINNGAVAGHATIPHGINLPLRTLKTHAGLSDAEARSALRLRHLEEPLVSATESFAQEFVSAGQELFDSFVPERVWVVSPAGEYFARALSHPSVGELFPQGGQVRALLPRHAHGQLGGAQSQDLPLLLEVIYLKYIS